MSQRLRITDVVRVPLRDLGEVGSIEPAWNPGAETLAAASGRRIVPHHGGSALGIVTHLHLVAAWSHAPWLELLHDPPVGDSRHLFAELADPPRVGADGCCAVPAAPGPGVDIDPAAVA